MELLTTALSMAGFFHDVGKFAERAYAVEPGPKDMVRQEYNFAHAYHTERALLMLFNPARIGRQVGDDPECTVLNMASRHHKPRNNLELLVSEADRLASGHERVHADPLSASYDTEGRERKSKVPLVSILGRIRLEGHNGHPLHDWRYRITTPSGMISGDSIGDVFPVEASDYPAQSVKQDYETQWKAFKQAINPSGAQGLDPFDDFRTIFEISRLYQWCIPASTRKEDMPDVSLFDHSKVTGALAACLYLYHREVHGNIEALDKMTIRDRSTQKFLLFCGDISGIQNFIYHISSKGAYKHLKGRSFFVQILGEVLAHHITRVLGLTCVNILYASGGKFYLLLPNTEKTISILNKTITGANKELFHKFNGDLYIRAGWIPISGNDLTRMSGRTLYHIWDELTRSLITSDRKRYAAWIESEYDRFFSTDSRPPQSCNVCHRSYHAHGKDNGACVTCREMEELGRALGDARYMIIGSSRDEVDGRYVFHFLGNYVWLREDRKGLSPKDLVIYHLEDADLNDYPALHERKGVNSAVFFTGATHRFDNTFDEIAKKAKGIKRLGILRMDVDYLGKIFCEGLLNYAFPATSNKGRGVHEHRFHTIGRITTLSWQLSMFFSGVVPAIISRNKDWCDRVTVVYSGGDDLFLLGAWDALPHIAMEIRDRFNAFSCRNPSFSLSGGMVLTGGKFPVYKGAEMAGHAEGLAKKNITIIDQQTRKKDSFTFLDMPMNWVEFNEVKRWHNVLMELFENAENRPLLPRLKSIYSACRTCASKEKTTYTFDELEERIHAERWQWLMVYSLSRFTGRRPGLQSLVSELQRFMAGHVANTRRFGIELTGVLSRWTELELRDI